MALKRAFLLKAALLVIAAVVLSGCTPADTAGESRQAQSGPVSPPHNIGKKLKILHVMSYHSPWEWTDSQFEGFKNAFTDISVEYKVFQLDGKNRSTDEWLQSAGREAIALIDDWQPDLVYTSDDEALQYVVAQYNKSNLPFVFSGVNKLPEDYGLSRNPAVTGVLETEHFIESALLFKKIVPEARKIAVVFDDAPLWQPVTERMKDRLGVIPGLEFVAWDTIRTFAEYKEKIAEYQSTVDGICLVGIFAFKDEDGDNVPYRQVLKWTVENSRLPDFSFWSDRVNYGTFCAVSVSGYEQGLAAGLMARDILVNGLTPAGLPLQTTTRGQAEISLARARTLGLKIDSKTLLSSKIIDRYGWE